MLQPAVDFQVNPSDQTIRLGPLAVRFLITGENSNGSVAVFEVGGSCLYDNFGITIGDDAATVIVASSASGILCYSPVLLLSLQCKRYVEACLVET